MHRARSVCSPQQQKRIKCILCVRELWAIILASLRWFIASDLSCQSLVGMCGSEVTCTEIGLFKPIFIRWIVCLNGCLWQQLPVRDVPVGGEGPQESTQDVDVWSCQCCFLGTSLSVHGSDTTWNCTSLGTFLIFPLTSFANSLLSFVHENSTKCLLSWVAGAPELPKTALHGLKLLSVFQSGTWAVERLLGARPCWGPCSSK